MFLHTNICLQINFKALANLVQGGRICVLDTDLTYTIYLGAHVTRLTNTISEVKTVNALKYLTLIYVTKSASMYLACFKDSFRMQTVAQQTNSSMSDRPVYHTSNIAASNKEPRFRKYGMPNSNLKTLFFLQKCHMIFCK